MVKKLDKATEAKRVARGKIGSPPPTKHIPDKRDKPPKHKKRDIDGREL